MITLREITKKVGARLLFENVSITFNTGCRYGLTGPNGAGKSTLLKIVMGTEEATSGTVTLPRKVGFLKQNIEQFLDFRVIDVVIMGNSKLWNALAERDRLYEEEMTDEVGIRLGELEEIIGEEDGYTAEADAEILLNGMGIPASFHEQKMRVIPTDQQFRVLLCQALFGNPDALLLDEPTNHLDLESIGWLERFLHDYEGTLVVVSHDRHFLNAVTTHIADIDYDTIIVYPGNYDSMLVAKTSIRERTESENKSKEKKVAQLREFVAKFGAGTRASQVQSRLREIERLEPQELKKSNIQRPYIRFYPPEKPSGQLVFKTTELSKSYDGKPVIRNFTADIERGDKIGVIGNNGKGKTTLLKMLAGVLPYDTGRNELGHQVQIGYFPQNHSEVIDKKSSMTAFDWLKKRREGVYDQDIRSILGKMLFSGDDAFKPISHLSGGETARLIIGGMMLCNYNVLILDEPNNHLDLEAVSALSWALQDFKGTVLVASHDRDLINNSCTKIIALEEKGWRLFDGKLDEYFACRA
ncbi:MAG: ABC-F family ATP-binding cassette domain-containing protein [Verrucomicrobia bacterium]|nr:ABC-F family ATP-binding cassette domain-containing protein [Verrucomicrobiota bacterium]